MDGKTKHHRRGFGMTTKTLKDRIDELKKGCGNIFKHGKDGEQVGCEKKDLCPNCQVRLDELEGQRQEAIKWIKEDMELVNNNVLLRIEKDIALRFIVRWMKRLNITEDDLK